ncbi:MAG TPA: transposase [Pirellulaceae bacterium]|jgi:putative transposase|nr:transposase [Pirellulaceae bacterium]
METSVRKTIRRFDEPFHVHELTFSCVGRRPLLSEDWIRIEVCRAISQAVETHAFRLFAFVLMPEHVHLIVQPSRESASTADLLSASKRPSSYRIKTGLMQGNPRLVRSLMIGRRGGETFRFRKQGPGFDRNLTEPRAIVAAIDYVHANPVKRGLCARAIDWEWSSARASLLPEEPRRRELPTVSPVPSDLL